MKSTKEQDAPNRNLRQHIEQEQTVEIEEQAKLPIGNGNGDERNKT